MTHDARHLYEREAIAQIVAPFAKAKPAISDADRATEYALQIELAHVTSLMGDVIRRVNENSSLVKIDERAWADFCADELPSDLAWDEKLNAARMGWDAP